MQSEQESKMPSISAPQVRQAFPRIIGIRARQAEQNMFGSPSNGMPLPQSGQGIGRTAEIRTGICPASLRRTAATELICCSELQRSERR